MRCVNGIIVVAVGLSLCLGCTHTQLRKNAVRQAGTLTDIYEQQVLDNLARFAHDPNATPFFMYPISSGQGVTDRGAASSGTSWTRAGFAGQSIGLNADRVMNETWVMTPVHDVRRLELMRCAYQHAMQCAGIHAAISGNCPNCDRLQRKFYLGKPDAVYSTRGDTLAHYTEDTGRTTPACFAMVCWLGVGDKSCVPKNCDCLKVGHYCGTYVWVLPGGQQELTKLTFTTLDYALTPQAEPKPERKKVVTTWLDKSGVPTSPDNAVRREEYEAPLNEKNKPPEKAPTANLNSDDPKRSNTPGTGDYILPRIGAPQSGPFNFQPLELQLFQDKLAPRF